MMLLMASCTNKETDIREVLSEFMDRPMRIPYNKIERIYGGQNSALTYGRYRYVTYLDSTECVSCRLARLANNEYFVLNDTLLSDIKMEYIVQIPRNERYWVINCLNANSIRGNVYLDSTLALTASAPLLKDSRLLHSFVLNEHDEVVLVGNPFENKRLYKLLLDVIKDNK